MNYSPKIITLYDKIKDTPGEKHAWYNSSVGPIRKPNSSVDYLDSRTEKERIEDSNIKSETKVAVKSNMDKIMNAKSIFKSKLFWIGIINIVVGILNYIEGSLTNGVAITLNGILIVVFRYITTQGVYFKKPE